jgi:hypothetical protein
MDMGSPKYGEKVEASYIILNLYVHEIAKNIGIDSNILTFRPYGAKVKDQMSILINKNSDYINISFIDVDICDVSFVDEVVLNFIEESCKGSELLVFISDCNAGVILNIEAAIFHKEKKDKNKYPVLHYKNPSFEVIGSLENNLCETFELIKSKKTLTAADISTIYGIEINSASNRLKKLYDLGLVGRYENVDSSGKYFVYTLPEL